MGGRLLRSLLILAVIVSLTANFLFFIESSLHRLEFPKDAGKSSPWTRPRNWQNWQDIGRKTRETKHDDVGELADPVNTYSNEVSPTEEERTITITVYSSKSNVSVKVDHEKVFSASHVNYIGINVVVLNQETGVRMAVRNFDTFNIKEESDRLPNFIEEISVGRIICFTVKDEASNKLKRLTRSYLKKLGSAYINRLQWRDMWVFVIQKRELGARVLAEGFQKCGNKANSCGFGYGGWGSPIELVTSFVAERERHHCAWDDSDINRRRRKFCKQYEGYQGVCSCTNPRSIAVNPPAFPDGSRLHLPVAIMVGHRPPYFFRMLTTLQKVIGLDVSMVTVYIDGFYNESASIAELFGLRFEEHEPISRLNGRIAQHYKKSLTTSFDSNPDAQYMVILEEDLDVSVDILSFFKQLLPVLEKDDSLFCISAWNDQGYEHAANDPSMLYRIETMPGLGWVLSRKIYKGELEKKWPGPEVLFDWDMWTRGREQLKGRECIIPDISRTFHFGTKGMNVGPFMQGIYFQKHAFNTLPNVKLGAVNVMEKENYEKEIHKLIRTAEVLDHKKTPCSHLKTFIPDTKDKTYVFYITMKHRNDYQTWNNVARCFRIWDLDARGFHNAMFRLWYKKNHVIVVGCPASPYCSLKPHDIVPINMPKKEKRPLEPSAISTTDNL